MALIFFIIATGILLLCGFLFTPLYKAKVFLHYHKCNEMKVNDEDREIMLSEDEAKSNDQK